MTIQDAVADLVTPWVDVIDPMEKGDHHKAVDHAPLLVMLREATRANLGGNTRGATADNARSLLNLQALAVWEQITTEVRDATRRHTRDNPNPMLGFAVRNLAEKVDALWAVGQIDEGSYLQLEKRAHAWRANIWRLFHPPVEKTIDAPCPSCGHRMYLNDDGNQDFALIAFYSKGQQPDARCRVCRTEWNGEVGLMLLGRMIGAEVDEDALVEMGVA